MVLLAVSLCVACTFLGRWQWHRHIARDAEIAVIEGSYDADPVPLDTLLASPDARLAGHDVWRPVTVVGHYDARATALLRNRPVDGPGFHVLVPFMIDAGATGSRQGAPQVLVVDRGWVPMGDDGDRPTAVPAPPRGKVTIVVRLRAGEPPSDRGAPRGDVQAISVNQVLTAGGIHPSEVRAFDAYGAAASERPAARHAIGLLPKPSVDPGSHLSYAFQWWTFAAGSLVGFSVLARRELVEQDATEPAPARRPRRYSAEDAEDALIDSQL
jgi:cytochrome oxidase assembly protein ShyY1